MPTPTLFDGSRMHLNDSIALTIESLKLYGARHDHWAIAWSGGKDSTTLLTLVVHLFASGQVPRPRRFTVLYADTRMELTPLAIGAAAIVAKLREMGVDVRVALPALDDRFFVYMFGRGVPPPSNTFRWCTPQIKVEPMEAALRELVAGDGGKVLTLTGVRQGESAVRDGRIAMSCGKDGAECGQGWYQTALPEALTATLAPILHWRVCHVWDWLMFHAASPEQGRWPVRLLADAYGGDEAEEINARTGCIGCPLASRDKALEAIIENPYWAYLAPLMKLRPLYRELKLPPNRLRKPGGETRKDGSLASNQHRMGPLTMDARRMGVHRTLSIQGEVNAAALSLGRPTIDILNGEEVTRIYELIEANTWPNKWSGLEPRADEPFEEAGATLFDEEVPA